MWRWVSCWFVNRELWLPILVMTVVIAPYSSILRTAGCSWPNSGYCDYESLQLPTRQYANRMLGVGVFPFWNPHIGMGMPVVERQQSGLFYPPGWFALICDDCDWVIRATLLGHLAFLAISQFRLALLVGASPLTAASTTSVVCHSGYIHGHLLAGHVNLVYASCLVPAALRSAIMMSRGTCSAINCGGWLSLMYLTGHPQPVFYTVYAITLIAWPFSESIGRRRLNHRSRWWHPGLRRMCVAGCWAAAFSAVQLLPAIFLAVESRAVSERGTTEFADSVGVRYQDLASVFIEWPEGSPWSGGETSGKNYPHERSLWFGTTAVLWMVVSLCFWCRLDSVARRLGCLILIGFVVGLGSRTPAFVVFQCLPGYQLFRCHGRIMVVVVPMCGLFLARSFMRVIDRHLAVRGSLLCTVCICAEPVAAGCRLADSFGQTQSSELRDAAASIAASEKSTDGESDSFESSVHSASIPMKSAGLSQCHRCRIDIRSGCVLPLPMFPHVTTDSLRYSAASSHFIASGWCTPACCEGGALPKATLRAHSGLVSNIVPVASLIGCRSLQAAGRTLELPDSLPRFRLLRMDAPLKVPVERMDASGIRQLQGALIRPSYFSVIEYGNVVLIDLEIAHEATLVMAASMGRGWSCHDRVGLKKVESAHGIFRSVGLTSGQHKLTFRFVSWPTVAGALLSLAALIGAFCKAADDGCRRAIERIVDTRKCLF